MGKTWSGRLPACARWKHPHGRGEDFLLQTLSYMPWETPPRAWGRRGIWGENPCRLGNTPTGVGKTQSAVTQSGRVEKHPHGRGEDYLIFKGLAKQPETPPRAWGRRIWWQEVSGVPGNTPTGVGKTCRIWPSGGAGWKHPHGRGEDDLALVMTTYRAETPPRAWGRQVSEPIVVIYARNTPTGVGKTARATTLASGAGKHPHGRGED